MSDGTALARVAVDLPLPHLDRFFDYLVPDNLAADAVVGARVRVRFAGRACNGFIVERPTSTEVTGRLLPLTKVVSPEPVLLPDQVRLIRAVADHYAGTFADVARLAVTPRHAATESSASAIWPAPVVAMPPGGLRGLPAGESWLRGVESGRPLRGFWAVTPGWRGDDDWRRGVVQAVQAALLGGKGAIVVVPDATAMQAGFSALSAALGDGCVARLHTQMGPARRYHDYLALSRGQSRVVIGTRPAVFAPVHDLGLIVLVDDGSDAYAEHRAPYPHTRTVAALRAAGTPGEADGCALLLAGPARSCEAQRWIERGWLGVIEDEPKRRRNGSPAVRSVPEMASATHLPVEAAQTIRAGLIAGPVLVQVPRAGYLVALACQKCRTRVRCPTCNGPVGGELGGDGGRRLVCRWCGRTSVGWRCAVCGGTTLRAPVVGSGRTAEELGRAFPGFRVIDSSGDHIVESVGDQPALVVATPGAEPLPAAGYSAGVLLDADLMLSRADMRSGEESVRRWLNAISLVRPGPQGGTVCIVGGTHSSAVQAVLRVDAAGFAARELAERAAAGLPPATMFVEASGEPAALGDFVAALDLPLPGDSFGPVEIASTDGQPRGRMLWRCQLADAPALVSAMKAAMAKRSATKAAGVVRVQVDPDQMG